MKTNIYVQYQGHDASTEDFVATAKEYWKEGGNKVGQIKTLDIYVKPEEFSAYYNINDGEQKGRIEF